MRDCPFQLSGYVRLREYGFHLPCYREEHGNSWYVAVPEIPGDKLSPIVAFEPYFGDDVFMLEERERKLVEPGIQWHDVFTWTDRLLVGTRQDVLSDLESVLPAISAGAPLTAFDLMFDMGLDDEVLVRDLAGWLYGRFDEPNATQCLGETVLAPLARVRVFRALHGQCPSTPLSSGLVRLTRLGNRRIRLDVEPSVLSVLDELGSSQPLVTTLESMSAAAGVTLVHPLDPAGSRSVLTPTRDGLPRRAADFQTLGEALEYAARGRRGLNFHDARGTLTRAYPFRELHQDSLRVAHRLIEEGLAPGDRIALIADTAPEFVALFFGAVQAGAWPAPLPLPTTFGGRESYLDQLQVQLTSAAPVRFIYPEELSSLAGAAAEKVDVPGACWNELLAAGQITDSPLPPARPDDIALLQFSSGSTRFPHAVSLTHRGLLANMAAYSGAIALAETDRCISWLPWYADMGLMGALLAAVTNQISADFIKTEDFARRPLAWLDLISRNPDTSVSFSPAFGYDICTRRVSTQTVLAERFDLSRWRVAGCGGDMIRPDVMQAFVDTYSEAGFGARSFVSSYGLAEATHAIAIMPPGEGAICEIIEEDLLASPMPLQARASLVAADWQPPAERYRAVVNCGRPVREMEVEIRGDDGSRLSEREIGKVHCRGPSVMVGYFRDEEATDACLDADNWLDTGDMGYLSDGYLYIVGRAKDMIIINGKNHWPQDIEWAVEQLPGFKAGDIAAFAITTPGGEETPAVLVQCRTSDAEERGRLRDMIRERVRAITGINCVVELVPPRSLPRTSSGKLSRAKARNLYLSGEMPTYEMAA